MANRHVIHVYDHQRTCWDALFTFLSVRSPAELEGIDVEALDDDLFGDCAPPAPSRLDIATIVERVRKGDPCPAYVPLEGRAFCDPHGLATLAREKDMRSSEINALLVERHTPLARIIYPSALDFRRAFDDAMRELEFPGEAPPPKGIVLFEPPPSNPLRPGPHHDLPRLFAEMLGKGSELLGKRLQHDGPVEWSRRIIKGWFGVAHTHRILSGHIRINCLLNSADFSEETLRLLLWHEYLHVHLSRVIPLSSGGSSGCGPTTPRATARWMACTRSLACSTGEPFGRDTCQSKRVYDAGGDQNRQPEQDEH